MPVCRPITPSLPIHRPLQDLHNDFQQQAKYTNPEDGKYNAYRNVENLKQRMRVIPESRNYILNYNRENLTRLFEVL
jgi:hypothetical protein